jgi:hypothetical protein
MLQAITAEIDAKRVDSGEHVSCLFEEVEMPEARLSFEEAAERWEMIRAEVATKTSGLRGKAKPRVRMLPKTGDEFEEEKITTKKVVEVEESFWVKEEEEHETVTSKGIPFVMIDDA